MLVDYRTRYEVHYGDTLYSIAREFGTTIDKIVRINQLASPLLWVGQQLTVPVRRFEVQNGQSDSRQPTQYKAVTAYTVTQPILVNGTNINQGSFVSLNYQPAGEPYPYVYVPIANFSMVGAKVAWDDVNQVLTVTSDYNQLVNRIKDLEAQIQYLNTVLSSYAVPVYGNSPDNIRQYGFVAKQGDWLYYKKFNAPTSIYGKLYKINNNGSGDTKLSDDDPDYINVLGNFIYYREQTSWNLFKIGTDGTGRTRLNTDRVNYITVVDDWIYYSNESDGGKIYKIRTDGSMRTKISEDRSHSLNIVGDLIYYRNPDDFFIYKIHTDGTGWTQVSNTRTSAVTVIGDWIYYSFDTIYRMKTDGTNITKLSNDMVADYNIYDGWIYYIIKQAGSGGMLYKTRLDGSERIFVFTLVVRINAFSDWIYYIPRENVIYRIKPDGTANQKLGG